MEGERGRGKKAGRQGILIGWDRTEGHTLITM